VLASGERPAAREGRWAGGWGVRWAAGSGCARFCFWFADGGGEEHTAGGGGASPRPSRAGNVISNKSMALEI
jgi:hypothetical protein